MPDRTNLIAFAGVLLLAIFSGAAETARAAELECAVTQPSASRWSELAVAARTSLLTAPAWNLPSDKGGMINSATFAGKVILVNFWATWCPYCTNEMPSLVTLQTNYSAAGLVIVGISIDDAVGSSPPTSLVASFATDYKVNYPVVMSRPGGTSVENAYGSIAYPAQGTMSSIPTSFVINGQNQIVQVFVGEQTYQQFEAAVRPLLLQRSSVSYAVTNHQLNLSWPMAEPPFALRTASGIGNGAVWIKVPVQSTQTNATRQSFTTPISGTNQFYLLREP